MADIILRVSQPAGQFPFLPTFTEAIMESKRYTRSVQFLALLALAVLGDAQQAAGDSFRLTGSMNYARGEHQATLLPNGKVLVAGGDALDSAEMYNPVTGIWTQPNSMTNGWGGRSLTLLTNGMVLLIWGDGSSVELYDPETGTRTATGAMVATHAELAAVTVLRNRKVLVFEGGASGNRAELYDPATGIWAATGSLNTRRTAAATLLPNGKVLVAGGWNNSAGHLASAELYDPASETWTLISSLDTPLYGNSATLLPSGKVLVAGGYDGGYVAAAKLYDPATETWTTTGSLNMQRCPG